MRKNRHLLFLLTLSLMSGALFGQAQSNLDIALRHLEANQAEWGLDKADLDDLKISDHVFSKFGEIDHYYFIQRHEGIEVYNAVTAVHVNQKGKVAALRHNFIPQLASKINTTSNRLNEADAVKQVLTSLEIPSTNFNFTPISKADGVTTFAKGTASHVDINVRQRYQVIGDEVKLAWDVTLDPTKNSDYWSIRVDAVDGAILDKTNFTVHCKFHKDTNATHSASCKDHNHDTPLVKTTTTNAESISAMGGTYNVFAELVDGFLSPFESPVHGDRTIITDPADPTASPFGWHDNNGDNEPDFDITRGNNVHAYLDTNDDNVPDPASAVTVGDVSGGSELVFDFPWTDADGGPEDSEEAAVTNLFFMNNYLHDFTYAYGFDESAGNFQQNQNGNADSGGNDYVRAEAQDGRELFYADPMDPHINNASFATPADGASPRMQMFVWSRSGGRFLEVLEPSNISGPYETGTAGYGPAPVEAPVENAPITLAFDEDLTNPSFVCGDVRPDLDLTGQVALLDRGGCFFRDKTVNAEAAGAIAVILCNFEELALTLGAPPLDGTPDPVIPTISLAATDCNIIKSVIANGGDVRVSIGTGGLENADFFDGDVDNGIIAHEYGHGISNRLIGGPSQAGCVSNGEQMGEGWSDFFGLVTAQKPGQDGSERRGIGTYVTRETPNGRGIRSNPYSTDLSIRPETFEDVPTAALPHGLGAIWNSMLWDLYWAMVDEHGFSSDLINGEAGNNIALRLVMEGMKMTACSPGFVDGRDGILAADQFLYDGENSCAIWRVFARRGLGENASQGDNNSAGDGIADFSSPIDCLDEILITKAVSASEGNERFADVVNPGESVDIVMNITNAKQTSVSEVTLTETIAPGTTISNISNGGSVSGDNIVWELGAMEPLDAFEITYTLTTDPNTRSRTQLFDNLETPGTWFSLTDSQDNPDLIQNLFELGSENAGLGTFSGNSAYFIADIFEESRENLLLAEPIEVTGNNPGLRFFHNFDTEAGSDGVLLQVSTDGEVYRDITSDQFIKNSYPRPLAFGTFTLPFLEAFSGDSEGWIDTWVDLSAYQGQTILLRFRFGSDANNDSNLEAIGWAMDNFEVLDIERFNTSATLTTAEEDLLELTLPEGGIKINSDGVVAVDDVNNPTLGFNIYPNPATETVNLSINNLSAKDAQLSVFNYSGQLIEERIINLTAGTQTEQVNVTNYPTGFYFFRLTTERGVATEKIMVGK